MQPTSEMTIRRAVQADEVFLLDALYHALFVPPGQARPPRAILEIPRLRAYVSGWSAQREPGVITECAGKPIGAAWLRLLQGDQAGYGHIADHIPELAISVLPEFRGRGVGSAMLGELMRVATQTFAAISLSVSPANPARRLYVRYGFQDAVIRDDSVIMIRRLADREP